MSQSLSQVEGPTVREISAGGLTHLGVQVPDTS